MAASPRITRGPWLARPQFGLGSSAWLALADWTLQRYTKLGVRLEPGNRLERAREILRASDARELVPTRDDTRTVALITEATRTAWDFYVIARALPKRRTPDLAGKLKMMFRGPDLPPDDAQTSDMPRDIQFEFSVAALFAMGGVEATSAPPDLQFNYHGRPWGLEAKRVRSRQQLAKRVSKAVEQLQEQQMPGIIAVNVDGYLDELPLDGSSEDVGRRFEERIQALQAMLPRLLEQPWLRGVLSLGTVFSWSFTGARPLFVSGSFTYFRGFVADEAEGAESVAFFDAMRRRIDERLG
jgi:hypothetical protein